MEFRSFYSKEPIDNQQTTKSNGATKFIIKKTHIVNYVRFFYDKF